MEPLFEKAEKYVSEYFGQSQSDPSKGVISYHGERYILVRASSMSVHFLEFIMKMYPGLNQEEGLDAAAIILYDMAHALGLADAKKFTQDLNITDPLEKLSLGPVHFSHSGWAFVDIKPESAPVPNENFLLIYDHPYSFEAEAWLQQGKHTTRCMCHMSSGYSSGWSEESYGLKLVAREVLCRAKGDPFCRFLMAPPQKIEAVVRDYQKKNPALFGSGTK